MLGITYAPLPEREAYLKRIGYSGGTEPTLDNLHALIRAHQTAVPFENLDCVSRTPILLEVERLFDKIVLRRRGGYCFELNGLFMALLRDLGYDAWSVLARVQIASDSLREICHRGTLVRLDGKEYYCDVGMGGSMAPFAVELSDRRQTLFGETFWVEPLGNGWFIEKRLSGNGAEEPAEKNVVVFAPLPVLAEDFEPYNYVDWARPDSSFVTRGPMAALRTETGYKNLRNGTFSVRDGGTVTEREIPPEELSSLLKAEFGLEWQGESRIDTERTDPDEDRETGTV